MKIFYAHSALDDLVRLHDFIAKENNIAADKIAKQLTQAINRLSDFPQLGKTFKQSNNKSLRDLITGNYIIRYAIVSEEIHILRLWHGKENYFN